MSEVPLYSGYLKPRSLNTLRVVLSGWELKSMHSILWVRSLDRSRPWRMSRFIDGSLSLAREPVRKVCTPPEPLIE
jgi:hypothetical protein